MLTLVEPIFRMIEYLACVLLLHFFVWTHHTKASTINISMKRFSQ